MMVVKATEGFDVVSFFVYKEKSTDLTNITKWSAQLTIKANDKVHVKRNASHCHSESSGRLIPQGKNKTTELN